MSQSELFQAVEKLSLDELVELKKVVEHQLARKALKSLSKEAIESIDSQESLRNAKSLVSRVEAL
jgi:Mg/Co/Ni transporter MgtE